jgi:AAA domain
MGIPGAGKSRVAAEYVARGYLRLDRDERGGSLREVAEAPDDALTSGVQRVVLDNTYLTRAARSYVVAAASRHGLPTRCLWLDTPLAQAQVNLVERLLDRFGSLPSPEELRGLARREPGLLLPTSQMRALRELEPPSTDEKMVEVEQLLFARTPTVHGRIGSFVAAAALKQSGWERALEQADRDAPHLVFDWSPGGTIDVLADCVAPRLGHGLGAGRECPLPTRGRPTKLLVPPAASGTGARIRTSPRRQPVALDPRRDRTRTSHAGDDTRRRISSGLNSSAFPAYSASGRLDRRSRTCRLDVTGTNECCAALQAAGRTRRPGR